MSTPEPVGRLTRSRAKGLATPSTAQPAAKKTTTTRATRTAAKASKKDLDNNDVDAVAAAVSAEQAAASEQDSRRRTDDQLAEPLPKESEAGPSTETEPATEPEAEPTPVNLESLLSAPGSTGHVTTPEPSTSAPALADPAPAPEAEEEEEPMPEREVSMTDLPDDLEDDLEGSVGATSTPPPKAYEPTPDADATSTEFFPTPAAAPEAINIAQFVIPTPAADDTMDETAEAPATATEEPSDIAPTELTTDVTMCETASESLAVTTAAAEEPNEEARQSVGSTSVADELVGEADKDADMEVSDESMGEDDNGHEAGAADAAPAEEEAEEAPLSPPASPVAGGAPSAAPAEADVCAAAAAAAQSPVAALVKTSYASKTPGPVPVSKSARPKTPLTDPKSSARTPAFDKTARGAAAGGDAVVHAVRFTTPAKPEAAASTPTLKGAQTGGARKSALRPSTTFATPAAKKTGESTTASKSGKRVSISTPIHPKSETAPRHIVKTPYPRSGGSRVMDEEDDEDMEAAPAMESLGAAEATEGETQPTEAGDMDMDDVPLTASPLAKRDGDSVEPLAAETEVTQENSNTPAPKVADSAPSKAATPALSPLPVARPSPQTATGKASVRPSPQPVSVSKAPAKLSSETKSAKGYAALKALDQAEKAGGYAAMQASRPTSTPGSGGTGPLPSYMAPTAAAIGRAKDGQRLKSKVVVPEDYDPRSLGQIRKQLKEATAKKSASAAAGSSQPVIKSMTEMRKPKLIEKVSREVTPELADSDNDEKESKYNAAAEAALTSAMGGLKIARPGPPKVAPLKGLPVPQGKHIRFDKKGKPVESPRAARPLLRGVAPAHGSKLYFDEDGNPIKK